MTSLESAIKNTLSSVLREVRPDPDNRARSDLLRNNVGKVISIPLSEILLDENIRRTVDQSSESFERLCESIKQFGVLENAVVEI